VHRGAAVLARHDGLARRTPLRRASPRCLRAARSEPIARQGPTRARGLVGKSANRACFTYAPFKKPWTLTDNFLRRVSRDPLEGGVTQGDIETRGAGVRHHKAGMRAGNRLLEEPSLGLGFMAIYRHLDSGGEFALFKRLDQITIRTSLLGSPDGSGVRVGG